MQIKRFLSLVLAALLLISALPAVSAQNADLEQADIWDQITQLEDAALSKRYGTMSTASEQDFVSLSKAVEQLVLASSDYQPGTLERHGDFFFWQSRDGEPNGYSPRLRARIRESADANADPAAYSGVETVSYVTRGGCAGSLDVAVFQPYYGIDTSFQATYSTEGVRIAKALGGSSTTYKTTNATIDTIADAMESCGVIIFDSHGDTDYASGNDYTTRANTSYICLQSGAGFTSEDQKPVTGTYGTYYHAYNAGSYGSMKYYCADGTAIANHMEGRGKNNLLWMAICLGMATDGLQKPLREKGVEVVYGYSQSVTFTGDYKFEAAFWDQMIAGSNVAEAIAYMKQKVGIKDPYENQYPAYPIVVSSEDRYPGHGNVDKAQTVYSAWTLLTSYEVTAVSNNPAWGSVSVTGTTITASHATGYYAQGFEVLSGTASVTQNGNSFSVRPESDCTVRINFAAKTPATISFVTPEGVSCAAIHSYVGDELVMPAPTGKPLADLHEYLFLGWTEAAADNLTQNPGYLAAGSSLSIPGDRVYYALYTYAIKDSGDESTGFEKLTLAPADWSGEYIITYNSSVVFDASGRYTGAALGSKDAAVSMLNTGMSVNGIQILNASNDYVYVVEPSAAKDGAYTIRMKNSGNYLA